MRRAPNGKVIRFLNPLTDRDYYWLGYLQADGSISTDALILRFDQKLYEPILEFKQYLNSENKIIHSKAKFNRSEMFCFASRPYGSHLYLLGLKSILREDIYKSKHFWRGLIDGDGSIGITNCKYRYPRITVNGALYDMQQFINFIKNTFDLNLSVTHDATCRVGTMGSTAKKIIEYFYKDEYSALSYKSAIANKIINGCLE